MAPTGRPPAAAAAGGAGGPAPAANRQTRPPAVATSFCRKRGLATRDARARSTPAAPEQRPQGVSRSGDVAQGRFRTDEEAEEHAWRDYWGNPVRAPLGFKAFYIEDPEQEGPAARDGEAWVKFTPEVGPVGERKPLPYAFKRILRGPSQLVSLRLARPLGITFEMDGAGLTRVVELVADSRAQQASRVAALGAVNGSGFAQVGDVLRACTATTLEWGSRTELTGDLSGSQRRVVMFGADGQGWPAVQKALRSGLVADGDVELVLERPAPGSAAAEWAPSTLEDLERAAAAAEAADAQRQAEGLDEAQSFNLAVFAAAATTVGLFLAGFS